MLTAGRRRPNAKRRGRQDFRSDRIAQNRWCIDRVATRTASRISVRSVFSPVCRHVDQAVQCLAHGIGHCPRGPRGSSSHRRRAHRSSPKRILRIGVAGLMPRVCARTTATDRCMAMVVEPCRRQIRRASFLQARIERHQRCLAPSAGSLGFAAVDFQSPLRRILFTSTEQIGVDLQPFESPSRLRLAISKRLEVAERLCMSGALRFRHSHIWIAGCVRLTPAVESIAHNWAV